MYCQLCIKLYKLCVCLFIYNDFYSDFFSMLCCQNMCWPWSLKLSCHFYSTHGNDVKSTHKSSVILHQSSSSSSWRGGEKTMLLFTSRFLKINKEIDIDGASVYILLKSEHSLKILAAFAFISAIRTYECKSTISFRTLPSPFQPICQCATKPKSTLFKRSWKLIYLHIIITQHPYVQPEFITHRKPRPPR